VADRSGFSCVGSLFHDRGAATEKVLSAIRRRVRGTTRLPDDEARSADRAGTHAGGGCQQVRGVFWRVCKKRLVDQQAQFVLDPLYD